MTITKKLKTRATELTQKALTRFFADERRANAVANALGAVQRGKAAFDSSQDAVLHQFQFATKTDFKRLAKSLSSLKKRIESLSKKV
jgi:hypothetical protein